MKKILVTGAILSALSAQAFAQEAAPAPAAQTGAAASTGAAADTATTGGFFGQTSAVAGLSNGALAAIGVAVAAVAVAASDSDDSTTTHHGTTTHHR